MCDCKKIILDLMQRDKMNFETALEFFHYNFPKCKCKYWNS